MVQYVTVVSNQVFVVVKEEVFGVSVSTPVNTVPVKATWAVSPNDKASGRIRMTYNSCLKLRDLHVSHTKAKLRDPHVSHTLVDDIMMI